MSKGAILFDSRYKFLYYIFFALAYFISPIDLIPEAVFGLFGYVDDLSYIFYTVYTIAGIFY